MSDKAKNATVSTICILLLVIVCFLQFIWLKPDHGAAISAEIRNLQADVRSLEQKIGSQSDPYALRSEIDALKASTKAQSEMLAKIQADIEKIAARPAPRRMVVTPGVVPASETE